jgi:hypothetical protein
VLDALWQQLLALLDAEGKLDLEGSLDGSFVAGKRGEATAWGYKGKGSTAMVASEARGMPVARCVCRQHG